MTTLSILIPVYNEENTVSNVISVIKEVPLGAVKKEIIVVDDGSSDNTLSVLKTIQGIKLIEHHKNSGKGTAIRTALKHATGDIIIIQDADMEYDPHDYPALIKPVLENKAAVVYGSRRLKKTNKQHSGFFFFLGGVGLSRLTNILYPNAGITDEPTCYKVFRADVLKSIQLRCERFEFCPEVTAKVLKKGYKIHEIPVSYHPRNIQNGKKIKLRDGIEAIWTLIKYRFVD